MPKTVGNSFDVLENGVLQKVLRLRDGAATFYR